MVVCHHVGKKRKERRHAAVSEGKTLGRMCFIASVEEKLSWWSARIISLERQYGENQQSETWKQTVSLLHYLSAGHSFFQQSQMIGDSVDVLLRRVWSTPLTITLPPLFLCFFWAFSTLLLCFPYGAELSNTLTKSKIHWSVLQQLHHTSNHREEGMLESRPFVLVLLYLLISCFDECSLAGGLVHWEPSCF